mmetsp:Transcript_38214/g.43829  ORF Transcript_38214/g.43829 Transcript_38214/m.43829 type:complete len:88 (-) Transcript_38214:76-339(-)|eukprot:CAMPEP_0168326680 /NCGR_PEP_ID=MMETSP0213-20121227/5451_1 /TAXON_ID=151035 /ORGANISM="Euplotes harpa, Strain FSP1.4" /LENGTH=87 /DNA_ID=CAMNT_0008329449 /DNA_START=6 /DNA_END=269 /DNA_ORIENTATION=+
MAKVAQQKEKDFDSIEIRFEYLDMDPERKNKCVQLALDAYKKKYDQELKYYKDMAEVMKNELDKAFPGSWHVIVGSHFGSYCTYEVK